jgi:hypothetical protein
MPLRRFRKTNVGLNLNGTLQLLVYGNYMNIMGDKII